MSASVRIVPLGGLGEIGMNCLALESEGKTMVIDCGITFPDRDNGIDVLHPDFQFLHSDERKVCGLVITHGHEDHIGAIPYFLARANVPIHAPPYAARLIERRLAEHTLPASPSIITTALGEPYTLGPFRVTHLRVTHSIADATALAIETPAGLFLHTGDFNIDPEPPDGRHFDAPAFAELGKKGVRLLLSDSTNIDNVGFSGSESNVIGALRSQVHAARGRVVVTLFSSHIQRVNALLQIAKDLGKKVCLLGRAIQVHAAIATELRLMDIPSKVLVEPEEIQNIPQTDALIIASGSQAEPASSLYRLSIDAHPYLRLESGDTVVHSARVIPGNERAVFAMWNEFERRQIRVVTRREDAALHVSGHGCQGEQTQMIRLTKPRSFVPVHGTYHHLHKHSKLAETLGVSECVVIENGDVLEVTPESCRVVDHVSTGRVAIQAARPLHEAVLSERVALGQGGIAVTILQIDRDRELSRMPRVFTRGVLSQGDANEAHNEAAKYVHQALRQALDFENPIHINKLESIATRSLRRYFRKALGQKPTTYAIVLGP
ncbi:MAG: ribonuclease J [Myxococcales bacterium]|nr:ribonuclease J [Myxococcales bacterium]MCB9708334.1 ribonuclease J [Myxococcales bacterium]